MKYQEIFSISWFSLSQIDPSATDYFPIRIIFKSPVKLETCPFCKLNCHDLAHQLHMYGSYFQAYLCKRSMTCMIDKSWKRLSFPRSFDLKSRVSVKLVVMVHNSNASNQTRPQCLLGIQNGASEKTLANGRSHVPKNIRDFDYFEMATGFVIG